MEENCGRKLNQKVIVRKKIISGETLKTASFYRDKISLKIRLARILSIRSVSENIRGKGNQNIRDKRIDPRVYPNIRLSGSVSYDIRVETISSPSLARD